MSNNKKTSIGMQLFCIPFAGGSKKAFKDLASYIDKDIEIIPIEYPGHDSRVGEECCKSIDELKDDVKRQMLIARKKNIPYSVLGYSMGSIVTYELISDIANTNSSVIEMPSHVFLCANESVAKYVPKMDMMVMSDEDIYRVLLSMGGTNEKILKDKRFFDAFTRPIRADYSILNNYTYVRKEKLPKVDCTILYSEKDMLFEQVKGWIELFDGKVNFYELGDNHFFVLNEAAKMSSIINSNIRR